jgi:ABC-type sugar transport system ATPase subunit
MSVAEGLTAAPSSEGELHLGMELRDIAKSFGETRALQGVSLVIRAGEILGIAGPNGAGKSTLVRILAGEELRDEGEVLVGEEPWSAEDSRNRVAVVHQEPQLWPNLTVAQNMMVGREPGSFAFPDMPPSDGSVLNQLQIDGYANRLLADCPLAVRQRVEIGRALARDAAVFLFDEPNSALTEEESNRLFASMHDLAARGRLVLLVSHRLGELVAHCDRVAVIRDGVVAAELTGPALTEAGIARELVLGYQAVTAEGFSSPETPTTRASTGQGRRGPVLQLAVWRSTDGEFQDVSLTVARGEITALVGVEGSGAREIVASSAGFAPASGSISVDEAAGLAAARERTAYLPADRRGMLFANLSVGENLVVRLAGPDIAGVAGWLEPRRVAVVARRLVDRFRVRTGSTRSPLPSLSGGNQQKVAIAAAIARRPSLLVLEEPTRGVDVGSKAEIYQILRGYARDGHGVLVYCTEIPEVYELADTVIVVDDGRPGRPMRVADFPDLTALADAIASFEHTAVEAEDLALSGASVDPATVDRAGGGQ